MLVKKEYRGARTADAFEAYIKEQVISKLKIVESVPDFMASQVRINFNFFSKLIGNMRILPRDGTN